MSRPVRDVRPLKLWVDKLPTTNNLGHDGVTIPKRWKNKFALYRLRRLSVVQRVAVFAFTSDCNNSIYSCCINDINLRTRQQTCCFIRYEVQNQKTCANIEYMLTSCDQHQYCISAASAFLFVSDSFAPKSHKMNCRLYLYRIIFTVIDTFTSYNVDHFQDCDDALHLVSCMIMLACSSLMRKQRTSRLSSLIKDLREPHNQKVVNWSRFFRMVLAFKCHNVCELERAP